MKLIFVRHGETDYNKKRVHMGSEIDAPLNLDGFAQARALLDQLYDDFEVIFSSPLKRAYDTAHIIATRFHKKIIVKDDLKEKKFGTLAGKTWEEIEFIAGKDLKEIDRVMRYDYRPYGGESFSDVRHRVIHFLHDIAHEPYEKVVVVSHGGVIRVMYKLIFNREIEERIPNATLHEFEV